MNLLRLAGAACADQGCPTIYATDHATLVVQGVSVPPDEVSHIGQAPDEAFVEIPESLLDDLVRSRAAR